MVQTAASPLEIQAFTRGLVSHHPLPASGLVVIGRGEGNDIVLEDPAISRRHAALYLGPSVHVEDTDSTNGTRVISRVITTDTARTLETRLAPGQRMELHAGDGILLGITLLTLQVRDPENVPVSLRKLRPRGAPIFIAPIMRQLQERLDRVARGSISVLLLGETGVGKEIIAEAIHERSHRAAKPFLAMSCAEFSEPLLQSELFGHEAGAFTGATRAKPGLLEMADGGTVFLDEVGELPQSIQVKLLRVLEERKVRRIGGLRPRTIDVRFISATNRDLTAEVKRGAFRQDLFFRLNGVTFVIPPLRERVAEIVPLARSFILHYAEQVGERSPPDLSPEAIAALERHDWPGNIRELRNVIERAVMLTGNAGPLLPEHLELHHDATAAKMATTRADTLRMRKVDPEEDRARILEMLARFGGNQTKTAEQLGISRRTLINRLEAYGIARPKKV